LEIAVRLATANRSRVSICVAKYRDAGAPPHAMWAWLTPTITPLPTIPCQMSFSVKRCECNYRHPVGKFDPSRPAFQGHSMSITGSNMDQWLTDP